MEKLSPNIILGVVLAYFLVLLVISWITGRKASHQTFFIGERKSPWFLVAFGMVGASLSGVTFISVPGWVGSSHFTYMQMVGGYMLGYFVIGAVLMPIYYKWNLTSIYVYLRDRLGIFSYKSGAVFFLISRVMGASFRLYLVAMVFDKFVFQPMGMKMPFWMPVTLTILLIWVYTFRGGIKTIVWTDTLQTLFMLLALVFTIVAVSDSLHIRFGELFSVIKETDYSQVFVWDFMPANNFFKHFLGGAFIAITMTGMDQDMMQKNLSCRNLKEAQKNMFWFSVVLFFVNLIFLALGALLYLYVAANGITAPGDSDELYPMLALNYFTPFIGIVFILGLTAAAYSSADSALTALTTSFCIDFLGFKEKGVAQQRLRYLVHIGFSVLLILVIVVFEKVKNDALIAQLFVVATYTYGPLLGLFSFAILTKRKLIEPIVPFICVVSIVACYFLKAYSPKLLGGYQIGFELLIINGLITFLGLMIISKTNFTGNGRTV